MTTNHFSSHTLANGLQVLIKEMQSLGLDVKVLTEDNQEIEIKESVELEGIASLESIPDLDMDAEFAVEEETLGAAGFMEDGPDAAEEGDDLDTDEVDDLLMDDSTDEL